MKDILGILAVLCIVVAVAIGGWKLERYINYKWEYGPLIQAEIKPLTERIQKLEAEVQVLKTNKF